jgi:hypothetical protein
MAARNGRDAMTPSRRPAAISARPLAEYALRQIDPLVAKRGFGESALILRWPEIVGERIAALCAPERLKWPPRPRRKADKTSAEDGQKACADRSRDHEPATLVLRVEPGFSLDIQHMTPAIVDRVNAHLGWRCVSRIVQHQAITGLAQRVQHRRTPAPPDPIIRARARAAVAGIADPALQAVLQRLGENALR